MKIKIKNDARKIYTSSFSGRPFNREWAEKLEKIQGMVLEVETEYLFKDQYSTAPIEGVSELGMRIMQESVEEVIDDIRIIRQRCNWCGKNSNRKLDECPHCKRSDYLEKLGNATNAVKFITEHGE